MKALLINPYIYDFAAYSFWSTPLGMLYVGSILRKNNIDINLIDCLDVIEDKRKPDGRAPFIKEIVEKPESLKGIKKHLRRYGIPKNRLHEKLSQIETPDIILITSIMTYWYEGSKEVLELTKECFPSAKTIVGGIYPSLCSDHAEQSLNKADLIIKNNETLKFYKFIEDEFNIVLPFKPSMYDFDRLPYPCFDLYENIHFIPLLTSYGCIYNCDFCATPFMHPKIVRRGEKNVMDEIQHWHNMNIKNFVLYDDNFLYKPEIYAKPLLKSISKLPFKINIYNPNAVNASMIDEELAHLLISSGFKEVRIGLETINPDMQKYLCGKVTCAAFEKSVDLLLSAGFTYDSIGAYILAGLPFQQKEDVKNAIDYLANLKVNIHIAEYTPIPHTTLFEKYYSYARYPIADNPIYQNNSLFPFAWEGFTEKDLQHLKRYAKEKIKNKGL